MPRHRLIAGQRFKSPASGRTYVLDAHLSSGGGGEVWRGRALHCAEYPTVAVKLVGDVTSWHAESYFGQVLRGQRRVLPLVDSFTAPLATCARPVVGHFIVTPFMADGSVLSTRVPWSPHTVRRELTALLQLLADLQAVGFEHGDIKPSNILVGPGRRLLLGDFGLARTVLPSRAHRAVLDGSPWHEAPSRRGGRRTRWLPSDDVYMVASVGLYLLTGVEPSNGRVDLSGVDDEDLAAALWLSRQERHLRPRDAAEMLGLLRGQWRVRPRPPATLDGVTVVVGGVATRDARSSRELRTALRRAGAVSQDQVGLSTRLLIRGPGDDSRCATQVIAARAAQLRGQQLSIVTDRWLTQRLAGR